MVIYFPDELMNMGPLFDLGELEKGQPGYRMAERRKAEDEAYEQIVNARSVIASIDGRPLPNEHWKGLTVEQQEKLKVKRVKEGARTFGFVFKDDDRYRETLYQHLGDIIDEFAKKLPVSACWLIQYRTKDRWFSTKIDHYTLPRLQQQIYNDTLEWMNAPWEDRASLLDQDFIYSDSPLHRSVWHIQELHFLDITAYYGLAYVNRVVEPKMSDEIIKAREALKNVGMTDVQIDAILKPQYTKYKTREGQFFKYTCTLPLNLEKFQIFNKIDQHACDIIDEYNCVVWALKQAGIDDDAVERVKALIGTRHFPWSKFQAIADEIHVGFIITYYRPNSSKTDTKRILPKEPSDDDNVVKLFMFDDHYMIDSTVNATTYGIKHFDEIKQHPKVIKAGWTDNEILTTVRYKSSKDVYEKSPSVQTPIMDILKCLVLGEYLEPIHFGDFFGKSATLHKQKLAPLEKLEYNEKYCCRKKEKKEYVKKENVKEGAMYFTLKKVVYADFECSTDGTHQAYNICAMTADGQKFSSWGINCASDFLNWVEMEHGTQVYFHNLSYDINFLVPLFQKIIGNPIIKGGRTMQMDVIYKKKVFRFKDSLAIISDKLENFPEMFQLDGIQKEVFPYTFYDSQHVRQPYGDIEEACRHLKNDEDRQQFRENIKQLQCECDGGMFDLEKYSTFYCMQDVRILHDGFERFRKDLLETFDIDAYHFVSISSIANRLFEQEVYWKNGNLYDLAGTPREFISRAILGGRVMMAHNKKVKVENHEAVCDFDAVSLYPSAIARLYTIEGKPKVINTKVCGIHWLINALMDDDQRYSTPGKFISGFVVEIKITNVKKPRAFPLIVRNPALGDNEEGERAVNEPCTMVVDHITLLDLIKYQEIEFTLVRGYYWDGPRDYSIRDAIQHLFNLRKKYKAEKNPIQAIIKLLMNSIYGKTILKPIEYKTVFKTVAESIPYVVKNYNTIESMERLFDSELVRIKKLQPICDHFNFCLLGVNILSMSKRIMNEVMCLAEDNDIPIYYQDTDSMHLLQKDVERLAQLFEKEYGRPLIGTNLGQFHSDFNSIDPSVKEMPHADCSIFCGKKSYIDLLVDVENNVGFHCRMKGIPMEALEVRANTQFPGLPVYYDKRLHLFVPKGDKKYNGIPQTYTIWNMYLSLYDGYMIEFDLCDGGRPCFDMKDNFSIETKKEFKRKIRFE